MYLLTKCLPLLEERLIDWEDLKRYYITSNQKKWLMEEEYGSSYT